MYDELTKKVINSSLTDYARTRMLEFLQRTESRTEGTILCLMKNTKDQWYYGTYGTHNVEALEPRLRELGHSLLYEIDGILFAVPQFNSIQELEDVTVDEANAELILTPKKAQ